MFKLIPTLALLIGLASVASAIPFCTPGATTYCFTNVFPQDGHVIGDQSIFAIQAVSIDLASTITIKIRTNYENIFLNPFTVNGTSKSYILEVGDFFITSGDGTLRYGIPLHSHAGTANNPALTAGSVTAGHLYRVDNIANGTMTSTQAMNDVGDINYNTGIPVWLRNNAGAITDVGVGSPLVNVASTGGNGLSLAKYDVSLSFVRPVSPADPFNVLVGGAWGFTFSSADCANDYFSGKVPEPETYWLMSCGFIAMGIGSRLRNKFC